ncbi:MAG: zinc ribbon domain-containing protein [Spirochaetales bacterium]
MPIFEYTCASCGNRFEVLVLTKKSVECPHCGSSNLRKEFSTFAVHGGPSRSSRAERPTCSPSCGGGFEQGTCGSGLCCGG